jgi:hypothetical protein
MSQSMSAISPTPRWSRVPLREHAGSCARRHAIRSSGSDACFVGPGQLEGASFSQHRPGDAGKLVGRREVFLDVILEGPATWKVRPVVELFYDKAWLETETRSALVGAIWQVRDDLSFDAAYRYALENGRRVNEIRAGLTFAFKVEGDKTSMRPGVTFGNWGLSR